jgi:hypothetical protein
LSVENISEDNVKVRCDSIRPQQFGNIISTVPNYEQMTSSKLRYTGRFIMFSVITNIYNKKTK